MSQAPHVLMVDCVVPGLGLRSAGTVVTQSECPGSWEWLLSTGFVQECPELDENSDELLTRVCELLSQAKRQKSAIALALQVPVESIEPLLTVENGIEQVGGGYYSLANEPGDEPPKSSSLEESDSK